MADKAFEHTIPFFTVQTNGAGTIRYPLVIVTLIQPGGNRIDLPLLFDTGASVTTRRHGLYPLLGVPSWDSGIAITTNTAGGADPVQGYQYEATLEFLGKVVQCPVNLLVLPLNPYYLGLFGRDQIFREFGFGFWERSHELYVTLNP